MSDLIVPNFDDEEEEVLATVETEEEDIFTGGFETEDLPENSFCHYRPHLNRCHPTRSDIGTNDRSGGHGSD